MEESREWSLHEKKMSWSRWVAVLSSNPPSQTRFHQTYASMIPTLFLVTIMFPETSLFKSPFCCWTGDWSFSRLLHRGQRVLIWLIPWVKFSSEISRPKIGTGFWLWSKLQEAHGTSLPQILLSCCLDSPKGTYVSRSSACNRLKTTQSSPAHRLSSLFY